MLTSGFVLCFVLGFFLHQEKPFSFPPARKVSLTHAHLLPRRRPMIALLFVKAAFPQVLTGSHLRRRPPPLAFPHFSHLPFQPLVTLPNLHLLFHTSLCSTFLPASSHLSAFLSLHPLPPPATLHPTPHPSSINKAPRRLRGVGWGGTKKNNNSNFTRGVCCDYRNNKRRTLCKLIYMSSLLSTIPHLAPPSPPPPLPAGATRQTSPSP